MNARYAEQSMILTLFLGENSRVRQWLDEHGNAVLRLEAYPTDVSIHVCRKTLRRLIDACLDLQATLAKSGGDE